MTTTDFTYGNNGFCGRLYNIGGEKLIIVIQGLKGLELPSKYAELFADNGFSALAMSYYGSEGLPRKMRAVPLEMFECAAAEMKKYGFEKIGIYGNSKGGGMALITASQISCFSLCIAVSATAHIFQGSGRSCENPCKSMAAYHGRDFPYVPNDDLMKLFARRCIKERKVRLLYLIEEWEKKGCAENEIPVEKINGEVLLITASHDESVPAKADAELLMNRLKEHNFPYPYRHVNSETGSHNLGYFAVNNWALPREKKFPDQCRKAREDTLEIILETMKNW